MKLKKIASLMLAGIMAVSMLAGCKSDTTPTTPDENTIPSVSDSTSTFYKELNVTMRDRLDAVAAGSDVTAALAAGLNDVRQVDNYNRFATNGIVAVNDSVREGIADALDAKEGIGGNFANTKENTKGVVLYAIGGGVSDAAALKTAAAQFARDMGNNVNAFPLSGRNGVDTYEYSYTISASVGSLDAKSTNTGDVVGAVKYVLVVINQTATKV